MQYTTVPTGQHQLPPLPYPYYALEPIISETALRIHHNKHHKAYVDGLNRAEINMEEARRINNFELINYWENELAFNGSGDILHSIFWTVMTPPGTGGQPGQNTLYQIEKYFGSFEAFKGQFMQAADKVQGSGWGILTWQPTWRRLEILQAKNHQNSTQWSGMPILVCDTWEHAYYLDYQNNRTKYVEAWWNLVNWYEVERRLLLAYHGQVPMTLRFNV